MINSTPIDVSTAAEAPLLLTAKNLSVGFYPPFEKPIHAVRDFSLEIREGEFVGLMGEPGCGKSTAAIALMGLVKPPGWIEGGSVIYRGRDLTIMAEADKAKIRGNEIGLVVQNPRTSLHPLLKVGVQISNVIRAHNRVSRREAWDRSVELLRMVGINDPGRRANAYAHELSSGMVQRVLIAMALSSSPKLLIADEPTSGLDVTIQTQFLDQMWEATQATGAAVLLVTQNLGIVANYCDRVVVMKDGAVVEAAPVRQFFTAPQHEYSRRVLALQRSKTDAPNDRRVRSATIPDGAPLVEVRNLSKQFEVHGSKSVVHAADHVSFRIRPGECLGLVGESGSGKTTTGRCLLRLETLTGGEFLFHGESLSQLSEPAFRPYRSKLQIVFQDPFDSMNPRWTVGEVVTELLDLHTTMDASTKVRRLDELLTLVGLDPGVKTLLPRQLSAGRQQRVAIARAIATNPEFVVLDEPTSALTPETTAEIISLLIGLSRRLGLAYLFISHDLTTVDYLCHQVAVMYLGQIVEIGTKEQVFETPSHPYTRALLAAHLFPDLHTRRVDRAERPLLRGEIPSPIDLPQGCYLYGRCPSQMERCSRTRQELAALPGDKNDGRTVRCWRVTEGDMTAVEINPVVNA